MVEREISIQAEAALSDAEMERIAHARARIDYGPPDMQYAVAPNVWRAAAWVGDEPVALAGIVRRAVAVGGRTLDVGGIGSVR